MNFSVHKTRTWRGRHGNKIERLAQILRERLIEEPTIIEVGPGAIVKSYMQRIPVCDEEDRGRLARKFQQLLNAAEAKERDREGSELATSEPFELYSGLRNVGIGRLFIVEKDPKILDLLSGLNLPNAHIIEHDIEQGPITYKGTPITGDAVIAWKVLDYCRNYDAALNTLVDATREDRYLSVTPTKKHDYIPEGFIQRKPGVYWKEIPKKKSVWARRAPGIDEDRIMKLMNA